MSRASVPRVTVSPTTPLLSSKFLILLRRLFSKSDGTASSAISSGNGRCGNNNCPSSSTAPALVYFPPGTYKISAPIVAWYYTQLVGDAIVSTDMVT
jgi:hypothetical protein